MSSLFDATTALIVKLSKYYSVKSMHCFII